MKLNGVEIDKDGYSYVSGSTIITLKASYLNTLDVGEFALIAEYVDGAAESVLNIIAPTVPDDDTGTTPDDDQNDESDEVLDQDEDNTNNGSNDNPSDDKEAVTENIGVENEDKNSDTEKDTASSTADEAVNTGDHSSIYLWLITTLTAMAALVTSHFARARKRD